MYQSIDDEEDKAAESAADRPKSGHPKSGRGNWVFLAALIGVTLLAIIAVRSTVPKPADTGETQSGAELLVQYRAAISEPKAALRRARLIDFIQTHPDHDRIKAARAQLGVLTEAEAVDWARLSQTLYNLRASRVDKEQALARYTKAWGPGYLGGRGPEVASFHEMLGLKAPPLPSMAGDINAVDLKIHDFAPPPDTFPQGTPSNEMLGAPIQSAEIIEPAETVRAPVITPPTARKNIKPKYPSNAQRRGVEARVTLLLDIDKTGRVENVQLSTVQADKFQRQFVRAARRAAKRTRFNPQTIDGQPASVAGVTKTYVFDIAE